MHTHAIADFHVPSVVTKNLKMNMVSGRSTPKVRVSSNFLPLMGFDEGQRIITTPSLDGGFIVRPSDQGDHKIYSRRYNRARTNKPFEAVMEFANKQLMRTFPPACERFHVKMRHGDIKISPIPNRTAAIIRRLSGHNPLNALAAMTGGVDIHAMESVGMKVDAVIEYRPDEARDVTAGRSLSEINALNTLRNGTPRILMNEDIYQLDPRMLRKLADEGDPISIFSAGIQCDDHSRAKGAKAKAKSVEDFSTTVDMIYPTLRAIEELEPMLVVVENVPGFGTSAAGDILKTTLRRWGYHISEAVMDARDYGGIQSRRRYHMVASVFPGYEHPAPQERNTTPIWPIVEARLHECRDITDSYAITSPKAVERGGNYITRESTYCPTIIKSQDRLVKDGCYIADGGRIYAPSPALIKDLMSIPQDEEGFVTSWMAKEQEVELLGQSVDYSMHKALMGSIKDHLIENAGNRTIVRTRQTELFAS